MPFHIDHMSLASPHLFRSADALAKETGLGYWTGEWLGDTSVNIVPLGPPGNFLEISGFIDIFTLRSINEHKQWILDITATGDHFNGLCLGEDSMEELEVFAKHWKSEINRADNPDPSRHFQRANGYILPMASTPVGKRSVWMKGLPNVYYYPDRVHHSSGQPTHPVPNQVRPSGITWVEVGGSAEQMADWLGGSQYVEMLPLKFNGKSLGVWAVAGHDTREIAMNIHIDHFSLGARNAFESAARLRQETGLGFWTGECVRDISCHMVPLGHGPDGKDAFIEIQCSVDAHAHLKDTRPNYLYDVLSVGNDDKGDYCRPEKWPMGLPTFYYYPDVPGRTSNQPVVAAPHLRTPAGVKWVTFGGTNELLSEWMGCDAEKTIPVRFNGKAVGVWEVSVAMADGGDVVIRRPAAASVISDESKYRRAT